MTLPQLLAECSHRRASESCRNQQDFVHRQRAPHENSRQSLVVNLTFNLLGSPISSVFAIPLSSHKAGVSPGRARRPCPMARAR